MGNPKLFQFLWNPNRITIGFAWEFYSYKSDGYGVDDWRLEISIQIPLVALSIYLERPGVMECASGCGCREGDNSDNHPGAPCRFVKYAK